MGTKHELIIKHITGLEVGTRISVRKLAQELGVSEGTAYRAIKEAEKQELVETLPRAGTYRIEKHKPNNIERLSYEEVVSIVDGVVLGGHNGLDRNLKKFVIGAMTLKAMKKYLSPGDLVIVGNREEVHTFALENGCAVLITGGFKCSTKARELAYKKCLPIISSAYDTFTTATIINRAISDRMIKKEILLVEDIMTVNPKYLTLNDDISAWKLFFNITGHSRFPVVNNDMQVLGILTAKDILEDSGQDIKSIMTPNPITVGMKTTVAYASHIMIWESIEMLPVVENKRLMGVVSRKDVIKALQYMRNQPHVEDTLEDIALSNFQNVRLPNGMQFTGNITPMFLSHIGTASWSSMSMLICTAGIIALRKYKQPDIMVDSFNVYYIYPVEVDDKLDIFVEVIKEGRSYSKAEISVRHEGDLVAKALLSAKTIRK